MEKTKIMRNGGLEELEKAVQNSVGQRDEGKLCDKKEAQKLVDRYFSYASVYK